VGEQELGARKSGVEMCEKLREKSRLVKNLENGVGIGNCGLWGVEGA
jgi:hypothetical protein